MSAASGAPLGHFLSGNLPVFSFNLAPMTSLNDQYIKERDGICRHLRSLRLLKNVSILNQPPLFGRVLAEVMKANSVPLKDAASNDEQLNYVLNWWGEVKSMRHRP